MGAGGEGLISHILCSTPSGRTSLRSVRPKLLPAILSNPVTLGVTVALSLPEFWDKVIFSVGIVRNHPGFGPAGELRFAPFDQNCS